jgi:uncharacterized protein YqhQ
MAAESAELAMARAAIIVLIFILYVWGIGVQKSVNTVS